MYSEVKVKLAMLSIINHKSRVDVSINAFKRAKEEYSAFIEKLPSRVEELERLLKVSLSYVAQAIVEKKSKLLTPPQDIVQQDCSPGPKKNLRV